MANIPKYYRNAVVRNVVLSLVKLFENVKFITQDSKQIDNSAPFVNYIDENNIPREKIIPVPIGWGYYDKAWAMEQIRKRAEKGNGQLQQAYRPIPSICLTLDSVSYNGERHTSALTSRMFYESDSTTPVYDPVIDSYFSDMSPVPYDLGFSLELQCRSFDQVCQFMEQVLPYFKPQRSLRLKEFNFLNIERDLKVYLSGTSADLMKDVTMDEEKRTFSFTLSMVVEAFFYNVINPVGIIKKINSKYIVNEQDERKVQKYFELFNTNFVAPVTTYDPSTGKFVVSKDANGDVIYQTIPPEDEVSLLEVYDEKVIENYDVLYYSGASGVSGTMQTTILPYQTFAGSGIEIIATV